jgi:hypothetical protein
MNNRGVGWPNLRFMIRWKKTVEALPVRRDELLEGRCRWTLYSLRTSTATDNAGRPRFMAQGVPGLDFPAWRR